MARPKARVRIQDLSKDIKVSEEEMKRVTGGGIQLRTSSAAGYCISNPLLSGGRAGYCVSNPLLGEAETRFKTTK